MKKDNNKQEIILLKLDTGDTVICRKVITYTDYIIVEHPLNLVYNPMNNNMIMIPFMIGVNSDSQITIQKSHIVASVSEPAIDKSLYDKYIESISGLVIPDSNMANKLQIISN